MTTAVGPRLDVRVQSWLAPVQRPAPDVVYIAITCLDRAGRETLQVMQFVTREYWAFADWLVGAHAGARRWVAWLRARAALALAGAARRSLGRRSGTAVILRHTLVPVIVRELLWLTQPRVRWEREPSLANVQCEVLRALAPSMVGDAVYPVRWRRVERADLPASRRFRNAWRDPGAGPIRVDMDAARAWHREHVRRARGPALAALDVAVLRALEAGDDPRVLVAAKQALRDLPRDPRIEAAQTPEDLVACWPAQLGPRSAE